MRILTTTLILAITSTIFGQDKVEFVPTKPGYYQNTILKGIGDYQEQTKPGKSHVRLKVDLEGKDLPTDPAEYKSIWHSSVISQGNTGTCWCFSTTSFFESEVKRISGKEVQLSEMYTVYWEYVERAKYFVKMRGKMTLGEGSETNAVAKIMKKYGAVPRTDYNGMLQGQSFHNHEEMFEEIHKYLNSVKKLNAWNEEEVVSTVRSILDHYMGAVPTKIKVDGKEMTPTAYLTNYLKLQPDDYVNIMSLMEKPYWAMSEYDVPDNWWNSDDYMNIPLDDFMTTIKEAIKGGYGVSIGGDVSEAGFVTEKQVAIIPTFDIPSENIDENARQFRFTNQTTTDDHAMHMVGYKEVDGETWFLIKDSGSGSRNCGPECKQFGYYFFHEDYIKLKMMTVTLHKDAAKAVIKKVKQ